MDTSITITGRTRTCGLLGNPVEHTLSPVIHNSLAREMGIELAYLPFRVPAGSVDAAVKGAQAMGFLGLNVTVPYKTEVIASLAEIDPVAKAIGAVNTLVRCENGFKGYNTDMPGLYRAMCQDGVNVEGSRVMILGAGGVARAIAFLMAEYNAEKVYILNRDESKAASLADEVNKYKGKEFAKGISINDWETVPGDGYLAVQATSVGMYPKVDAAVIENPAFYSKVAVGYDTIFNPGETKFMRLVKESGSPAYNGLKMLLYQGIIAYEYWTGTSVTEENAERVYAEMRRRLDGE